jgi:hypothetical protein
MPNSPSHKDQTARISLRSRNNVKERGENTTELALQPNRCSFPPLKSRLARRCPLYMATPRATSTGDFIALSLFFRGFSAKAVAPAPDLPWRCVWLAATPCAAAGGHLMEEMHRGRRE